MFLHARRLAFDHPASGARVELEAPLPAECVRLLAALSTPPCRDPMTATPHRFDLIVFDWDGTLFDSTALIVRCIQAACARPRRARCRATRRPRYVIGLGLSDALAHAAPGLPPRALPRARPALPPPLLRAPARARAVRRRAGDAAGAEGAPPPARGGHRQGAARARRRARHASQLQRRCSTPPAPPTRRRASRTRACCSS